MTELEEITTADEVPMNDPPHKEDPLLAVLNSLDAYNKILQETLTEQIHILKRTAVREIIMSCSLALNAVGIVYYFIHIN